MLPGWFSLPCLRLDYLSDAQSWTFGSVFARRLIVARAPAAAAERGCGQRLCGLRPAGPVRCAAMDWGYWTETGSARARSSASGMLMMSAIKASSCEREGGGPSLSAAMVIDFVPILDSIQMQCVGINSESTPIRKKS